MKVRLSDIHPNPFRDLRKYPLDPNKVRVLQESMRQTGFWNNVVVRKKGNRVELAYGHHRLAAAKAVFGKNAKVNMILKNLTDEQLFQIGAAENDEAYRMSPLFGNEVQEGAFRLLKVSPKHIALTQQTVRDGPGFSDRGFRQLLQSSTSVAGNLMHLLGSILSDKELLWNRRHWHEVATLRNYCDGISRIAKEFYKSR